MKKSLSMVIFFITLCLHAQHNYDNQNTIYSLSGNVGMGISTPGAKLHVNNGNNSYGTILANANESNFSLYAKTITTQPVNVESFRLGLKYANNENNGFISFYRGGGTSGGFLGFSTNGIERIKILNNGNIGMGISNPGAKLHVNNGDNSYGTILANANESNFSLYAKTITTQPVNVESFRLGLKYANNENNGFISFYRGGGTSGGFLGFSTNGIERMKILNSGDIGIGTTNPRGYKLAVNGKIRAKEIVVEASPWPDYVFKSDYKLPSLTEVAEYIKNEGHLPNIPSEKEVTENGIQLGEINTKLLEKIEELTLYTIQQDKEIKDLRKELQKIQKKIN